VDTATATETPPSSDRLDRMNRDELLVAAKLYKAIAEARLRTMNDLERRLESARRK
jgi:hypothetical protein